MARKGRRGALSRQTYFPSTGDELEDPHDGIVWECAKANAVTLPPNSTTASITKVRYALLIGHSSDTDEKIPRAIHDQDDRDWLTDINTIRKRLTGDGPDFREYVWNPTSNTWQQKVL